MRPVYWAIIIGIFALLVNLYFKKEYFYGTCGDRSFGLVKAITQDEINKDIDKDDPDKNGLNLPASVKVGDVRRIWVDEDCKKYDDGPANKTTPAGVSQQCREYPNGLDTNGKECPNSNPSIFTNVETSDNIRGTSSNARVTSEYDKLLGDREYTFEAGSRPTAEQDAESARMEEEQAARTAWNKANGIDTEWKPIGMDSGTLTIKPSDIPANLIRNTKFASDTNSNEDVDRDYWSKGTYSDSNFGGIVTSGNSDTSTSATSAYNSWISDKQKLLDENAKLRAALLALG